LLFEHFVTQNASLLVIGAFICLGLVIVLKVMYAMRQGLWWWVRVLAKSAVVYIVATFLFLAFADLRRHASTLGLCAACFSIAYSRPRSRHIPSSVKRKVIERHLRRKADYDPKEHHIDHIWPHSRGGSNSADNLRVIPRVENLRKGAKIPRLKELL
jgi:predicted membrane channel-forming protein YqfA (hemolysin III family)